MYYSFSRVSDICFLRLTSFSVILFLTSLKIELILFLFLFASSSISFKCFLILNIWYCTSFYFPRAVFRDISNRYFSFSQAFSIDRISWFLWFPFKMQSMQRICLSKSQKASIFFEWFSQSYNEVELKWLCTLDLFYYSGITKSSKVFTGST